ncbi:MAG: hypothetical protein FWC98_04420, partial [Bacteroidales bacterium]|nr:hypothetical protein [Bacteroidales bacterium]
MPIHRYTVFLIGLSFGLFFSPSLLKAGEELLLESSSPPSVRITGYNVLCGDDNTTTLIADIPFFYHRFRWSTGNTTDYSITVSPTTPETTFYIRVYDAADSLLGEATRTVFITTRPTATRVNDTLCPFEEREATVGMIDSDARFFVWSVDTIKNPHMVGDTRQSWDPPPYRPNRPGFDYLNVTVWDQPNILANYGSPRVIRTVFTVQMSTHAFFGRIPDQEIFQNRCFTTDSAMIEIGVAEFQLTANPDDDMICERDTLFLSVTGPSLHSITWSTGQNTTSISPVIDVGDTLFWVEVIDARTCVGQDTIQVTGLPMPAHIEIIPDDWIVYRGGTTTLRAI